MMARIVMGVLAAAGFAGCASTPPPPDFRAALVRPCADAADWSPWLLVDAWEGGEVYRPDTQFRADGVMVYAYEGTTYDNGKWSLDGDKLHFDTNDHYADYDGVFDGDSASGAMKNTAGDTGKWTLARACEP